MWGVFCSIAFCRLLLSKLSVETGDQRAGLFVPLHGFKMTGEMNMPLITWICIAAISLLVVGVRIFCGFSHREHTRKRHVFEMGYEWEEVYVAGDRVIHDEDDYGEDD